MLRQKGLNKGDYEVKPVGGTGQRLEAMTKDKSLAAAMMNPPFSIRAEKAGLKSIDTAAAALGAYQGSSAFVLRAWGAANTDTLVKYLQGYIEGLRWIARSQEQGRGGCAPRRAAETARGRRRAGLRCDAQRLQPGRRARHGGGEKRAEAPRASSKGERRPRRRSTLITAITRRRLPGFQAGVSRRLIPHCTRSASATPRNK